MKRAAAAAITSAAHLLQVCQLPQQLVVVHLTHEAHGLGFRGLGGGFGGEAGGREGKEYRDEELARAANP